MSVQDFSCQQIQEDESKWVNVAEKVHNDWSRCLNEIQVFEDLMDTDERNRLKLAKWLKIFGYMIMGVQNMMAFSAASISFIKYEVPSYIPTVLSGFTFVFSMTLWTRLGETSLKCLTAAEDSKRLKMMCRNIRRTLKDVIQDGKITETERLLIRDMIGQMNRRSEEIGTMSIVMKIFGKGITDNSNFKMFGQTKSYQHAFEGVDDIIQEIGRSQQSIKVKLPHVVRQFEDSQLQTQIHSNAIRT